MSAPVLTAEPARTLGRQLARLPAVPGTEGACTRIRQLVRLPGGPEQVARFAERVQVRLLACPPPELPIDQVSWASVQGDALVALRRAQAALGERDLQRVCEAGGDAALALIQALRIEELGPLLGPCPGRLPGAALDQLCARLLVAS